MESKRVRVAAFLSRETLENLERLARVLFPYQPEHRRSDIIDRLGLVARVENGLLVADERAQEQQAA
jgi:hypothetical protein